MDEDNGKETISKQTVQASVHTQTLRTLCTGRTYIKSLDDVGD